MANSHPGSYCGQDAYSDMFVTEKRNGILHREWASASVASATQGGCAELYARSAGDPQMWGGTAQSEGEGMETVVRRLTPLECTRLQGFPDGWVDIGDWVDTKGKLHKDSDSAKYKALGNSIAVGYANGRGFWMWLMKRISAQYERPATLGSLFDGIGGFPLAWEFYNGKGTARWASEIEEFPIAVTKYHFGEE